MCSWTGSTPSAIWRISRRFPYEYSLFVDATVVSANTPGRATIDAGYKAFATDGGEPVVLSGAPKGSALSVYGR